MSTTAWDNHFTRKQQVMSRMNDCEIAYVNPAVTKLSMLRDPSAKPYAARFLQPPVKVDDNITVYSLPALMPFYNKNRMINRLNVKKYVLPLINRIMAQQHFDNPVLWLYHPSYVDLAGTFCHGPLVYDCIDRHSAYKGQIDPVLVDAMELELAGKCDTVFATAQGLYDTLAPKCSHTHLIPNGANCELFGRVHSESFEIPEEMANIGTKIVGFVGALQECIDYELLCESADETPELTYVLIGPVIPGVDISALTAKKNVRHIAARPQNDLPRYIASFDCCINPFRSGRLAMDVSPLKFYEYLATGKPVVSTPQPLQVNDFKHIVRITDGAAGFAAACREAVNDNDALRISTQLEEAQKCSWDARVSLMREKLAMQNILV